jgi:hypothetical protein
MRLMLAECVFVLKIWVKACSSIRKAADRIMSCPVYGVAWPLQGYSSPGWPKFQCGCQQGYANTIHRTLLRTLGSSMAVGPAVTVACPFGARRICHGDQEQYYCHRSDSPQYSGRDQREAFHSSGAILRRVDGVLDRLFLGILQALLGQGGITAFHIPCRLSGLVLLRS